MISHRLCALAAAICLSVSAGARPQGNSIRGKVRDSLGRNVGQIIVQLETGNGVPVNIIATNNEGDFFFGGLSETSYILVISAPDFEPVSEHVDFVRTVGANDPGERRTVEITLIAKGAGTQARSNRTITGQSVPKAARAALDRAIKLTKENNQAEALAALDEAIKAYPDYFDAHFLRGSGLMQAGRLDEAIAAFEQARRINPKDDRVYQAFGQILMQQKKYALASQVFAEAARLNPTDPGILLMRAQALIEHAAVIDPARSKEAASEREAALGMADKALTRAFELSGKKLAAVHLQWARLYAKKGEPGRAADHLEEYLKMSPGVKNADTIREAIKTLRAPAGAKKP